MFCLNCRPGGELRTGENEVDGLKRLMTEVCTIALIALVAIATSNQNLKCTFISAELME